MRRYRSSDEDSARWDGFAFRDGDVVVSTRSKHGTTWVQHILLLFIHGDRRRTLPLVELSPWLDHLVEPRSAVVARLDAQDHRRVIKTHTRWTAYRSTRAPRTSSRPAIRSTQPCRCTTTGGTSTATACAS